MCGILYNPLTYFLNILFQGRKYMPTTVCEVRRQFFSFHHVGPELGGKYFVYLHWLATILFESWFLTEPEAQ